MSAARDGVVKWFQEGSSSVVQLSEVEGWWEEAVHETQESLQELLRGLVVDGTLACRTLSVESSQCTVYWLQEPEELQASAVQTTNVTTPLQTPKAGRPMSSSLKERLKRSRPRFVSPLLEGSRKKPRLESQERAVGRLDFSEAAPSVCAGGTCDYSAADNPRKAPESTAMSSSFCELNTSGHLETDISALEKELAAKREQLRKLKMVKSYRTKNDLTKLQGLIHKWREVSQEAAESLLEATSKQPKPSMAQLLDHLHIDHDLIKYSPEEESFY